MSRQAKSGEEGVEGEFENDAFPRLTSLACPPDPSKKEVEEEEEE